VIVFKGITHVFIALILYFSIFNFDLVTSIAIALGSLFPDIDTPYSVLGRYNIFTFIMKHRGRLHTLPGLLLISIVVYLFLDDFVWGFVYGYGLHLIMDTITPMGIMWLYPYNKHYYSLFGKRKNPHKARIK